MSSTFVEAYLMTETVILTMTIMTTREYRSRFQSHNVPKVCVSLLRIGFYSIILCALEGDAERVWAFVNRIPAAKVGVFS